MSTKTKWEKEELLRVLHTQRLTLRCDLQHKLNEKAKQLTKGLSNNINILLKEKEDILKKNDLLNLIGNQYGCDAISLNQELKVFDKNTDIERKKILNG